MVDPILPPPLIHEPKNKLVMIAGQTLNLSEDAFGNIQAGSITFESMNFLPNLTGLYDSICDDTRPVPPPLSTAQTAPSWETPFPLLPASAVWDDRAQKFIDALMELGVLTPGTDEDDLALMLGCFAAFGQGSLLCSGSVSFEDLYGSLYYLTYDQVKTLHLWWVAVHMAVEFAGWYPWHICDSTEDAEALLSFPTVLEEPKRTDVKDMYYLCRDLEYSTPIRVERKGPDQHLLAQVFLNPAVAAYAARYEICGDYHPQTQMSAVDVLVEWFRGPIKKPSFYVFDPLISALKAEDDWAGKAGAHDQVTGAAIPDAEGAVHDFDIDQFDLPWQAISQTMPPFSVPWCNFAGRQGWMHWSATKYAYKFGPLCLNNNPTCYSPYNLWSWYSSKNKIVAPAGVDSDEHSSLWWGLRVKIGGCEKASRVFCCLAAAMNVPAVFGFTLMGKFHTTVKLPTKGLALRHADDLWGPGASLFPANKLWINADVALAARQLYWQQVLDGIDETSLALEDRMATQVHCRYHVLRHYLESMVEATQIADYKQVALNAAVFKASPFGAARDSKVAFGAVRKWCQSSSNPLLAPKEDLKSTPVADALVPLVRDDWGPDSTKWPSTIWEEPRMQKLVAAAYDTLTLSLLGFEVAT